MHQYVIQGDSTKKLTGKITCSGAKNVAVKAIITALLTDDKVFLSNIPDIGDVKNTIELIEDLGVQCNYDKDNSKLTIDPSSIFNKSKLKCANRTAISLFGILAHKFNTATLPLMSGCKLGARGVDFHFAIYNKFGIEILQVDNCYKMHKKNDLTGQNIVLPYPSIGATETALFLAVLAKGKTVIYNVAIEPEIIEIINMLQMMGANIIWKSKRTLEIYGVDKLHGTKFEIMPDRLEIVTWAVLAAISDGSIEINNAKLNYVQSFLGHFLNIGGGVEYLAPGNLRFFKAKNFKTADLTADVYPALATDQLAQIGIMLAFAGGSLHDTVYEARIKDISDMFNVFGVKTRLVDECMGAKCRFDAAGFDHVVHIEKSDNFTVLMQFVDLPKNIRCAQSYILLASQIDEKIRLNDPTGSVDRGYGKDVLINKMKSIGIDIR